MSFDACQAQKELLSNLDFNLNESDLFRIYQSVDLANVGKTLTHKTKLNPKYESLLDPSRRPCHK